MLLNKDIAIEFKTFFLSLLDTDIHSSYRQYPNNIWVKYFYSLFSLNAIIDEPFLVNSIKNDMLFRTIFNKSDKYSNAIGSVSAFEIKFTSNDITTIFKSFIYNDVYKITGIDYITFSKLSQEDMNTILIEISAYNARKMDKMNALNDLENI